MKQGVWKSDWFVGLIITLVFLFLVLMQSDFIQSIERDAYDFGVQSSSRAASDKIAVIAIDDESISNIGRWPWSRDIHAQMHELLTEGGAKVIGQTALFSEPQLDPGLQFIQELQAAFQESSLSSIPQYVEELNQNIDDSRRLVKNKRDANGRAAIKKIKEYLENSPLQTQVSEEIAAYQEYIAAAEIALDSDKILAESMQRTGNVVLAMPFESYADFIGNPDEALPEYVQRNKLPENNIIDNPTVNPDGWRPKSMASPLPPIHNIGEATLNIGTLVSIPDIDGGIRSEPLVIDYYEDFYPSIALILAAKSLNLDISDIKVTFGSDVQLGRLTIKTDEESQMKTFFYKNDGYESVFPVDSFFDVIQGKIPTSKYKGKIVLIGATASGVGNNFVTPIDPFMSPVLTLAHSVSSILNEDFFIEPEWAGNAQFAALLFVALYLMLLLPRMGAAAGFIVTIALFIIFFSTHYVLMTEYSLWLQLMTPSLLLVAGHILLTTKRFLLTERGKARLDIESAESNRMLGLSMQGQGQLDMAFEKFRKLPVDKSALELLYNLALDYERKRQFNKAKSVYDYITDHDANFRDIKTRSNRATAMDETVVLGGGSSPGGTLVLDDGSIEKPMLGRYEIEKELGKGAMGAVYLGKDPKISRVVAIKTMALSQEFENDELVEVKERFFREAETAGRLNHPNIVTIFDAGDEHDLAYIAMEYLKGSDLVKYIKKDNLLPVTKVLSLIQQAADGLSYAHSFNVVHRDIKPANIMWDPETDSLKITDFGIARITDSSKTKTGMVLGTPSYMSPEQLAGKKVGGQSDIFSLGVMLFQMVTGQLPFVGDSMAALMYKIANEAHPAPQSINPDLPRCIGVIINRALQKDTEKRYQTGKQMADDIEKCLRIMAAEGKG